MGRSWTGRDLNGVQHVFFQCLGCGGPHSVTMPTWDWNGSLDYPTFSPSLLIRGVQWPAGETFRNPAHVYAEPGEQTVCHSFVREGRIEYLNDCTHELRGQTIDLPEVKEPEDLS